MKIPNEVMDMLQRNWLLQLYSEFDLINYRKRLKMSRPLLQIIDSKNHWGMWSPTTRTLSLSQQLILSHPWDTVLSVLKHEMAHQWVFENHSNLDVKAHGAEFLAACEKVNVPFAYRRAGIDLCEVNLKDLESKALNAEALSSPVHALFQKTEKLLALAQSDNENEALLAMQKVQELYAKYNLEVFERLQPTDFIYRIIRIKKQKMEAYQQMIGSILTAHFFVELVICDEYDPMSFKKLKTLEIFGTPQNVAMAEYVFHFLENTSRILTEAFVKKSFCPTPSSTRMLKKSYRLGILDGFSQKLKRNEQQAQEREKQNASGVTSSAPFAGSSTSRALSLIKNDVRLSNFISERYPTLRSKSSGGSTINPDAYSAGIKDGNNLTLHRGIAQQKTSFGGYLN